MAPWAGQTPSFHPILITPTENRLSVSLALRVITKVSKHMHARRQNLCMREGEKRDRADIFTCQHRTRPHPIRSLAPTRIIARRRIRRPARSPHSHVQENDVVKQRSPRRPSSLGPSILE